MFRVGLCALVALAIGGCTASNPSVTAGYSGAPSGQALVQSDAIDGYSETAPRRRSAAIGKGTREPLGGRSDARAIRLDPERALALINAYRKESGLPPLHLNARLTRAAKMHSRDLARSDRISHFGSDGSNPWERVARTGYKARLAAENVGTGQTSIEEVFKGWRNSESHNKNLLLPDARHMGIALVTNPKSEFRSFWTLVVAAPR